MSRRKLDLYGPSNDDIPADELEFAEAEAKIADDNARFAKLSKAKQRVAIAEDVLKWLGEGKINPRPGIYLSRSVEAVDASVMEDRVDGGQCTVCALGALFSCAVEKNDGLNDFWDYNLGIKQRAYLSPYFDERQLRLIESAFECTYFIGNENDEEATRAVSFGMRTPTSKECMRRIMTNIIKNNGIFKP